MSFSENELLYFSDISYWIDEKKDNKGFTPKENEIREIPKKINGENKQYKILKAEDNTKNGMQAMAVAPVVNGKADTSQVVIAYAGTNQSNKLDIAIDIQTVGAGSDKLKSFD
ncbi:hypothetical protein UAY_03404 [Enterococcus moraviensis ATCC BAA-383]|uniref:Uncharacterized protein n=1 Tax=Enterococcus moraviensis ATCC BAA-383 TaxID=1158609 RepID=R2T4M7_9ENTE|nr:hypothetical protein [Enterococcus moraviensis]EOH95214.1 hypothetical protein UAY_03404 [Enterococcus moraviensis ATCC BAA-383]EOT65144.1 hypothetical protein I586_02878 [Enterococcus moraviensis ATCC BAA-383]